MTTKTAVKRNNQRNTKGNQNSNDEDVNYTSNSKDDIAIAHTPENINWRWR